MKGGPFAVIHAGIYVLERFFEKKTRSLGAKIMFNTAMVKLVKEGNRVVGVIARKNDGSYIRINASRGVLLCTGGYAAREDMVAKVNPEAGVYYEIFVRSFADSDGDGVGDFNGIAAKITRR